MEKNRNELKSKFQKGDKPTEEHYADLIDSFVHRLEDDYVTVLPDATTTRKGIVEQATISEVETGNDDTRFVTPKGAKRAAEKHALVQSVNGQTGDITIETPQNEDSGWQTPILFNNIVNFGGAYERVRYRKINNLVTIEGVVKSNIENTGKNLEIFQLPTGFRPLRRHIYSCLKNGNVTVRIDVDKDGKVFCYAFHASWTSLDGISFMVE